MLKSTIAKIADNELFKRVFSKAENERAGQIFSMVTATIFALSGGAVENVEKLLYLQLLILRELAGGKEDNSC